MAVLSREELKVRLNSGEIIEEGSISADDLESYLGGAYIPLTIDRDRNKIANTIYSTNIEDDRDDIEIVTHPVPEYPVDKFRIPPREIAVLTTEETFDMPPDLVGRVGIRLSASQAGLIPLFGPQVDPGFNDQFYAVIYNASDQAYDLNEKDGRILKLEVHTLSSAVEEQYLEDSERTLPERGIPEPFMADTSTPNLSDVRQELIDRVDDIDEAVSENRATVSEVQNGYTQIVLFGVFLLATATFGALLPGVIEAASAVNIGWNLPTGALAVFLLAWSAIGFAIIWHSLATVRGDTSTVIEGQGPSVKKIIEGVERLNEGVTHLEESIASDMPVDEEEVAHLEDRISQLDEEVAQLHTRLENINELNGQQSRMRRVGMDLKNIEDEYNLSNLQQEIAQLNSQIEQLEEDSRSS